MIPSLMLLHVAQASCAISPPRTTVRTLALGPKTPILVDTTYHHGEGLAQRIRLRGPDGELVAARVEVRGLDVRLVPPRRWRPGRYVVEERADFDADGHRVRRVDAASAWFPLAEVVAGGSKAELTATATRWHRLQSYDGYSELYAIVQEGPGVDWVELEVRGVGVISRTTHTYKGEFRLWSGAEVPCNDEGLVQPVPGTGDLRVRVRYHGSDGAEGLGPWQRLGEASSGSIYDSKPLPPPGPASGRRADIQALRTWTPHQGSQDTQPNAPMTTHCGGLALTETVPTTVRPATRVLTDDARRLHTVEPDGSGLRFDGVPVPNLDPSRTQVFGSKHLVLVQSTNDIGVVLVTLSETQQRARHAFPNTRLSDLEVEKDQVVVTVKHPGGHRVRHRLSLDLHPLATEEPVWQPVEVRQVEDRVQLNGVALPSAPYGPHHAGSDLVLIQVANPDAPTLALFTDRGEPLWSLPRPGPVLGVRFDDAGVVVALDTNGRTPTVWARDRQGEVRHGESMPDLWESAPTDVRAIPWKGGELKFGWEGVWFEESPGHTTAPFLRSPGTHVGLLGEDLVLVQIEGTEMTQQRLRCTGVPLGVPNHWLAP